MPKIAIVGAGSVVFTRRLVGDLPSFPALESSHLSLMDVDEQRLALIGRLAEKMVRDSGVAATVDTTLDRRQALNGADYVITTIRVGDRDDVDRGIPQRFGVDQAVGDTITRRRHQRPPNGASAPTGIPRYTPLCSTR